MAMIRETAKLTHSRVICNNAHKDNTDTDAWDNISLGQVMGSLNYHLDVRADISSFHGCTTFRDHPRILSNDFEGAEKLVRSVPEASHPK